MHNKINVDPRGTDILGHGQFIISPFAIALAASILYYAPVIILQLYRYDLFGLYRTGLKIQDPILSHGLIVLVLTFLLATAKAKFRIVLTPRVIQSDFFFWLIFIVYSCISLVSLVILVVELDLLTLAHDMIFEPLQFALKLAMVGVKLSEGGLLKFYLLIHFLPVLWYLWVTKYECKRWFFLRKLFLFVFFAVIFFIFVLLTRRELIIYLILILLIGFGGRIKKAYLISVMAFVVAIFIYLVSMRLGDVDFGVEMYFTSEEFYPFQLSLFLLDEWIRQPYMRDLLQITPAVLFTDMPTTISPSVMSTYFNHNAAGPTVGLPYGVVAFGVVYPCVYIVANFIFLNQIRALASRGRANGALIPLYAFLLLKLFLLVRNGEFFNHFLDTLLFVTLYLPFVFVTSRVQHGKN
jgi:hypothetical protein